MIFMVGNGGGAFHEKPVEQEQGKGPKNARPLEAFGALEVPVQSLIQELLRRIRMALNAQSVELYLSAADEENFELCACEGPENYERSLLSLNRNEGIGAQIASSAQPVVVVSQSEIAKSNPVLKQKHREVFAALRVSDSVVGLLHLAFAEGPLLSDGDLFLLDLASYRIAAAVDSAAVRQSY